LRDRLSTAGLDAERLARSHDVGQQPFRREASGMALAYDPLLSADVLVDQGIATGREVLVIDQTRCTSCHNCMDACERRHGHGRLQLRGIQVENYLFPTACRHCEDPACLLCSVNGIVRLPGGEIKIVEENCIGCGACAERCPYDNIQMHPVDAGRGFLFKLIDLLIGSNERKRALEALDPKRLKVAVKCDLCAGYGDYACVTACPVGAAVRVDPARAFSGV
jgi:Fe-S-cluster-containing dehydrogenase component